MGQAIVAPKTIEWWMGLLEMLMGSAATIFRKLHEIIRP
jgi:hypothetical protein